MGWRWTTRPKYSSGVRSDPAELNPQVSMNILHWIILPRTINTTFTSYGGITAVRDASLYFIVDPVAGTTIITVRTADKGVNYAH